MSLIDGIRSPHQKDVVVSNTCYILSTSKGSACAHVGSIHFAQSTAQEHCIPHLDSVSIITERSPMRLILDIAKRAKCSCVGSCYSGPGSPSLSHCRDGEGREGR